MIVTSSRSGVPFRIVTLGRPRPRRIAREEDRHGRLEAVENHFFGSFGRRVLDERDHGLEVLETDVRVELDLLVDVRVALADARDDAEREAARIERGEVAGAEAGCDDHVAAVDYLIFRDAVQDQRGARLVELEEAGCVRVDVERGNGARRVGQERDLRDVVRDLGHLTDQAVPCDDRVVPGDSVVLPGRDHDLLGELVGRTGDHASGDRPVVLGKVGPRGR
jgi:hypothetical protein